MKKILIGTHNKGKFEEIASSDDCYKMHSCTEQKEDDMLELYKFPQSTCSLKVRICLAEKNLD